MAEFINTIDALGDDAVCDNIIQRTITEFKDNVVTSVGSRAFRHCNALETVDLPMVTSVGGDAFNNCKLLTSVKFQSLPTISGFSHCPALTSITDENFPEATKIDGLGFTASLVSIALSKVTSIGNSGLAQNWALTKADFPRLTVIGNGAFQYCSRLVALILRSDTVVTLASVGAFLGCLHIQGTVHSEVNPNGDKDGYVYVPRALVDSYKSATNWSTYADQFRALEDYTVDGTTTGELDETKI